jgi:hypothetical protein
LDRRRRADTLPVEFGESSVMRALRGVPLALLAVAVAGTVPATAQSWRTESLSRQVHGEEQLALEVRFAAGVLRIAPGDPATLYNAELRYDADLFRSEAEYTPADRHLLLGVTLRDRRHDLHWDDELPQYLDLSLSPAVPLALELEFGAAQAEIDLGGLSLMAAEIRTGASASQIAFTAPNRIRCRGLEVVAGGAEFAMEGLGNARCERIEFHGGAGDLTLGFTGAWDSGTETRVEIGVGVAELTLRLPTDIGVSVDLSRFLASFERDRFVRRGDRYYTRNFDDASVKLFIDIRAALGVIDVDWVQPGG